MRQCDPMEKASGCEKGKNKLIEIYLPLLDSLAASQRTTPLLWKLEQYLSGNPCVQQDQSTKQSFIKYCC